MKWKIAVLMIVIGWGLPACSEAEMNEGDAAAIPNGQGGFLGGGAGFTPTNTDLGQNPAGTDGSAGQDLSDMNVPRMGITIPIPATLASDTARAVCAYLDRCNYSVIAEEVLNESCEQVIERQMEDAVVTRLSPLQAQGLVSFNPQGNRACLAAIDSLACSLDFDSLARACADGFDGQVPLGDACSDHEVCEGDAYCNANEACPGTCEARATLGDACAEDAGCVAGTTCVRGACQGPSDLNGECGGEGPLCASGLYCTGENGAAGRCAQYRSEPAGSGDECDINAGPLCEDGLACVVDAGLFGVRFTCENRRQENQRCRPGLPDQCVRGLFCAETNINASDIDGVCRPAPGEGEPCGQAPVFQVCAAGLVCDGGLCNPRARLGEECAQNETCYSGACVGGECVPGHLCPP